MNYARQRQFYTRRDGLRRAGGATPEFDVDEPEPKEGLDAGARSAPSGAVPPWLTLLTDAYSRRMLAFYLTFDPPSYRSCMMALRECVRRFGRIPQILVGPEMDAAVINLSLCDTEFRSTRSLSSTSAKYRCNLPPGVQSDRGAATGCRCPEIPECGRDQGPEARTQPVR